jgi:hypothetical protein
VLLADGKIMISGGVQGAGNGHQGANTYEVLDPDNPAATMPSFDLDATYVESFTGKVRAGGVIVSHWLVVSSTLAAE